MADGKIEVELEARTEKFIAQSAAAGKRVRREFEAQRETTGTRGKPVYRSDEWVAVDKADEKRFREWRLKRIQDYLKERSGRDSGGSGGGGGKPPPLPSWVSGGGGLGGMINRWTSGGLQSPLAIAAQFGAALAGLRVVVGYVAYALRALLVPVRALANYIRIAADQARALYAKNLTSGGLGMGYVSRRSVLADVIGVSEQDVMQYGNAIGFLNKKVEFSAQIFADTNPQLTALSWETRALGHDFMALVAVFANEMAPAIRKVVAAVAFVTETIGPTIVKGMIRMVDATISAIPGIGTLYMAGTQLLKNFPGRPGAPDAPTSIQRVPASAWEKMGLIVGNFGGQNPQQETAKNTRKTVEVLNQIFMATPRGQQSGMFNPGYSAP